MRNLTVFEKVAAARGRLEALVCDMDTDEDNYVLHDACMQVLNDPAFQTQVGSCDHHHTYRGGLMVHTYEVASYALEMAKAFGEAVCREVLLTAAVWHDYMKIREYEVDEAGKIGKTPYRKLVRHVAGSHAEFLLAVAGKGLDPHIQMRIEHALLAHHGRQEWGSPVEPQTLESHLLHSADMISVRFGKDLW